MNTSLALLARRVPLRSSFSRPIAVQRHSIVLRRATSGTPITPPLRPLRIIVYDDLKAYVRRQKLHFRVALIVAGGLSIVVAIIAYRSGTFRVLYVNWAEPNQSPACQPERVYSSSYRHCHCQSTASGSESAAMPVAGTGSITLRVGLTNCSTDSGVNHAATYRRSQAPI